LGYCSNPKVRALPTIQNKDQKKTMVKAASRASMREQREALSNKLL